MRQSIDFGWIIEQVPPEDAFELLKLDDVTRQRHGQWRMNCPACNSARCFVFTEGEGFTCHRCEGTGRGDVIGLTAFVLDLRGQWEGAFELAQLAGASLKRGGTVRTRSTRTVRTANSVPESERGKVPHKASQSPRGGGHRRSPPQPAHDFDPAAFAEKLQYTEEVEELGITEDEAVSLGVGFYRGKLYQALRHPNGETAGYSSFANGELKLPAGKLLPMSANVVPLRKRA